MSTLYSHDHDIMQSAGQCGPLDLSVNKSKQQQLTNLSRHNNRIYEKHRVKSIENSDGLSLLNNECKLLQRQIVYHQQKQQLQSIIRQNNDHGNNISVIRKDGKYKTTREKLNVAAAAIEAAAKLLISSSTTRHQQHQSHPSSLTSSSPSSQASSPPCSIISSTLSRSISCSSPIIDHRSTTASPVEQVKQYGNFVGYGVGGHQQLTTTSRLPPPSLKLNSDNGFAITTGDSTIPVHQYSYMIGGLTTASMTTNNTTTSLYSIDSKQMINDNQIAAKDFQNDLQFHTNQNKILVRKPRLADNLCINDLSVSKKNRSRLSSQTTTNQKQSTRLEATIGNKKLIHHKPSSASPKINAKSSSSTTSTSPTSSTGKNLRAHLCNECGRSFSRSDMLTRHSRLHSGVKPYQCGKCHQVFSRSDHLSTHERTHTGEKPFQCQHCSYSACRRDMITRHMRTHSATTTTISSSTTPSRTSPSSTPHSMAQTATIVTDNHESIVSHGSFSTEPLSLSTTTATAGSASSPSWPAAMTLSAIASGRVLPIDLLDQQEQRPAQQEPLGLLKTN